MLNPEIVDEAIRDTCPHCAKDVPVELRPETGEWIHRPNGPMSVTLCLATNLRTKYKGTSNG